MNAFYSEIAATANYKPYIQKFWMLNNMQNALHTQARYALPNGCCTIVFISGGGAVFTCAGKMIHLLAGIYLSGQITERAGISLKPFSKAIMAQVKPWLPPIITGVSMDELADNVVSMEHINPPLNRQLAELDFSNEQAVIPALYLALDAYLQASGDSRFIQWVYNKLQATPTNIAAIAANSGYSQRRVEQKFKALIGVTAKEMQRILQLRRLLDDLSKPGYSDHLGTLAHRYGYYDQSHFIRSYQRIISEAPSQFNVGDYILPLTGHFDFLQL